MKPLRILSLCASTDFLEAMQGLLSRRPNTLSDGATTLDEALQKLSAESYDLVLWGSGFAPSDAAVLRHTLAKHHPNSRFLERLGTGVALLESELQLSLWQRA